MRYLSGVQKGVLSCLVKRKLVEQKKKGLRSIEVGELSQPHDCLGAVNVDTWRENHYCISNLSDVL